MDHATAILLKPERGVFTTAMQEVITEMRTDIQVSPFQKLKRHEIKHLYVKLVNTQTDASNASKE
ncbi:MAG: hypothetical protein LC102_01325 [Ignavibacteriales bacterium]|jgi:hypothetical protein|nr:MAG: hypothetical protein F9K26_08745 [Ignavibacteriaceae bacterium]MBW7873363.1 hypothetical protein [Ignavibacteria bacterium]MCZ2142053.1 hypothetical protein [Ignavibacteriales bacterium]OQY70886.1 MAG: hypothetical protein B6D45_10730 [Ignavibacteriales bacterium UTCHB3]MBV6444790.1 hypothetical protein [Ignavibacteriaceae bacterium]